jgi:hypothetical protein
MIVNELIKILEAFPPGIPVIVEWEGLFIDIRSDRIFLASSRRWGEYPEITNPDTVVIDADIA